MTFKPAVADAWQTDLESHVDFDGWQFLTRDSDGDPTNIAAATPLVYFGSLQDLLGRDKATGNIKPKNRWIHKIKWDLVVFDEYHFGAWRESAKELVEGEEERIAREEAELEAASKEKNVSERLKAKIADKQEPLERESDYIDILSPQLPKKGKKGCFAIIRKATLSLTKGVQLVKTCLLRMCLFW